MLNYCRCSRICKKTEQKQLDVEVNIYLDDKLAQNIPLAHDSIVETVTVTLKGTLCMKIEFTCENYVYLSVY